MLFDTTHSLFLLFGYLFAFLLLTSLVLFVKRKSTAIRVVQGTALMTVLLHYSSLWVNYFSGKTAVADASMLLPTYPCHIALWLLLIVAFFPNKEGRVFRLLAQFTFFLGIVGGILGNVLNENYAATPSLADWDVLKGLLSHISLFIGSVYLLPAGFFRIRMRETMAAVFFGLVGLLADGALVIGLHRIFGITPPNCMYLLEPPFPALPFISVWTIGLTALLAAFLIAAAVEQLCLPPTERWYTLLTQAIKNKKKENKA